MPKRVSDRDDLPRRGAPIRKLPAVVDMNDPEQAEQWEREWGEQWRDRQEQERHGDPG